MKLALKLFFENGKEIVIDINDRYTFSIVKNSTKHMICIDNEKFNFQLSNLFDQIITEYGKDIDPDYPYVINKLTLVKDGQIYEINKKCSINYEYSNFKNCETIFFSKEQ